MELSVTNQQSAHQVDEDRLLSAVRTVLADSPFKSGAVNVTVVDDSTIHELNRTYLAHDWPTDVLSFVLEEQNDHLIGEVVVSADRAADVAPDYGWSPGDELLLYAIHGALHLVGYRDQSAADAAQMRLAERAVLHNLGIDPKNALTDAGDQPTMAKSASQYGGTRAS